MPTQPIPVRLGDALIIVDVQRDFLPGGALAVREGHEVIAPLNECIQLFTRLGLPIFATRDWHPPEHCSFRAQGGQWPTHCVSGSPGAEFAPELDLPQDAIVISKATQTDADAYSGFQGTDLVERLRRMRCTRAFVGGLATEYCVRATALDAHAANFEVVVLEDAVRAVDVQPGDGTRALSEMVGRGVRLASVAELVP